MAWPSSMKDKLLLRILNELPLRVVLPLRAVNRQWKMVIETHICKEKKSLKIFSSLKKVLEYYQMLNTQGYLKDNGFQVDLEKFTESKKSLGQSGACRRPVKWELTKNFSVHLPGGSEFFPNFKLPEDDHLIVNFQPNSLVISLLLRLFPSVEYLVIFQIDSFNERHLRLPLMMLSLKSLQLYDTVPTKNNPSDSSNVPSNRGVSRPIQAIEDISNSYRHLYSLSLRHLKELALDGVFFGKYCLWELLMGVKDELALKRLKLSQFTEKQLMSSRILKAATAGAKVCDQLTHLTVDSVNYDVLEFFVQMFPNLKYFDLGIEQGVKSYDVFASIFYLSKLTELRLHCTDPNFLTPIKLNNIFQPYTFPAVKKLHLYVSQMNHEKLKLLTTRIFPTVQMLILDVDFYCCACETDYLTRMLTKYYCEKSESMGIHTQQPALLNSVCSSCVIELPSALPFGIKVHFYKSSKVIDTFSRLKKSFDLDQINQKLQKFTHKDLDKEEVDSSSDTPDSSPTREIPSRPNVLQRVRNGLRRSLDRVSTRRRRATATTVLSSASLASINNVASSTSSFSNPNSATASSSEGTVRNRSTANAVGSAEEAETSTNNLNELGRSLRTRDFEGRAWFELEEDEDDEEEEEEFDDDELELLNFGPSSDEDDEEYTLLFSETL